MFIKHALQETGSKTNGMSRDAGSIPCSSSLSGETLNRSPITIFQDKLLARTYYDEAGDYAVPNVLSPRDLVFRHKLDYHRQGRIFDE